MSEIKRYNIKSGFAVVMEVSKDGGFVSAKDYDKIQAENERLREFMNWAIDDVRYFTTKERWMTSDTKMKLDELGLDK